MEKVLILDFGGQYNQLIARRVRECNVYCEVHPYTMPVEAIKAYSPIGIIFTGGPGSVYEADSPQVDPAVFELGFPVLGICYGCQLLAHKLGGEFHIPHGLANAYLLPHVIEYNGVTTPTKFAAWPKYDHYVAPERYAEIAKMMGFAPQTATNEEGVKALADAVRKLMTEVGIPLSIKEAGEKDARSYIDPAKYEGVLETLAYRAFDDQCTTANPRLPRIEELKALYMKAYYGA